MTSDAPSRTVAPQTTMIDTGLAGDPELNAVYLIAAEEPCLVEAAPETDGAAVLAGLTRLGIGPNDLAHVVVTHVHMDHAGGAGALLERFPRAVVWVHGRGAPHLEDPGRLIASTDRTYGPARRAALYGSMRPCPRERIRAVEDGDAIALGDRRLTVVHTPGHASHHIALHDDASGALFTGEAVGSYLPWGPSYRPALPAPEADVDLALDSIARMQARHPTTLLTSHFGPVPNPADAFAAAADGVRRWSDVIRETLEDDLDADDETLASRARSLAGRDFQRDAGRALEPEMTRYDALGSIRMNALGLARYWRKRWEAEAAS